MNRGIQISIEDKRGEGKRKDYHYEGGIKSYVEHLNRSKEVIHEEPIYIEGEKMKSRLKSPSSTMMGLRAIFIHSPTISIHTKAEHMSPDSRRH